MQRVRFNLNFNYNGTNEAFSFPVCHHRYVGGCVLWNLTWYGYHVYDSGLIRCHWVVRLPEHEEKSSCRTGYPQRRSSTTDRRSSHLAMLSTW